VNKNRTLAQRKLILEEILKSTPILHQAYALKMEQDELNTLGAELLPYITKFTATRILSTSKEQSWHIQKVRDIEDTYWNPVFGIKGKLDATIDIRKPNGTFAVRIFKRE
jgi:hypothetical protein